MVSTPSDDLTDQLRELVRTGRFREALEAYRGPGEPAARADARLFAATAATRLGELDLGRGTGGRGLQRFAARGDIDGRMRALNLLGVIGFERGRLAEAEQRLTEALSIAYRLDDSSWPRGRATTSPRWPTCAAARTRRWGSTAARCSATSGSGDRRGTAETYHNLGLTYRQLADFDEAEKAVTQAVRHAESVGEPTLMALTSGGRAELRIEQGDVALA